VFAVSWFLDPSYSGSDCWGNWGNDTRTYVSTLAHGATAFSGRRVVGGPPGWPTNSLGDAISFDSHERMYVTWHSIAPNWSSAQVYVANSTALGPDFAEANFTTRVQMGGGNATAQENLASGYNDTVYLAWVAFDPSGDPHGSLAGVFVRTITGEAMASVAFNVPGSPPTTAVTLQDAATGTAYPLGTWTGSALARTGLPASTYKVMVDLAGDVSVAGIMPVATWSRTDVSLTVSMTSPLTALASAVPSTTDVGLAVDFGCTATGGVSPYTYAWTFGDGSAGSGSTASHVYSTSGSKTVTCTVTDSTSASATSSTTIVVSPAPTVSVTAAPTSVDVGHSVTFQASPSGGSGGFAYSWTGLPSGCTASASSSVTCAPTGPGTSSVTVTVTDSNGGTATSSRSFTVYAVPTLELAANPSSLLIGQAVTLNGAVHGGSGGYSYGWSGLPPGCTAAPDAATYICVPSSPGAYNITLTATDSNGVSAKSSVGVTVDPTFLGMPATQGYAVVGGIAFVIVAGVVVALVWARRKRRMPQPPPPSG
jgi:PKD repeat protein